MDYTANHTFDAPISEVWEMFIDEGSHRAKFEEMGHENVEVLESANTDGTFNIKISRLITVDLPGFAKRVLKPTNTVISTDEWRDNGDGTYGGNFVLETIGAPVEIKGVTKITPNGDRTDYRVAIELKVNVPLVGGKIANWAKGDAVKQLDLEFSAGDRWLAGDRPA